MGVGQIVVNHFSGNSGLNETLERMEEMAKEVWPRV
jgi:hypothetical protein